MSFRLSQLKDLETSGEVLVNLGPQPVSNRFLAEEGPQTAPCFPFQLRFEPAFGLVHLGTPFPLSELKPQYEWLTCFEPEDHLDGLAERLRGLPGITRTSLFGAYSFKDDSTLRRLERLGYDQNWRIDPLEDLGIQDPCANVESFQGAFTVSTAEDIRNRRGAADVFIIRHVVEHAFDLPTFLGAARRLVRPGGYLVWELPDCERALEHGDCTTLWEEHLYYFTGFTFRELMVQAGFVLCHHESVPYPLENSLVVIVQEAPPGTEPPLPEPQAVATEIARARRFVDLMKARKVLVRAKLEALRREHGPMGIFGAGHLTVAFLSFMGVADLIACVVDDNPHKKGLRMPLGGIEIVGSEALDPKVMGVCLLGLNPQNQPRVLARHVRFIEQGGIFASIFPGSELDLERIR